MQTIPAEVETLLKSRSMVGTNRPAHRITIAGAPLSGEVDLENRLNIPIAATAGTGEWYGGNQNGGSICELPSGKVLVHYMSPSQCMLSVVDSLDILLTTPIVAMANPYIFNVPYTTILLPFVSPLDGEVYMFRYQRWQSGICPCVVDLYKSPDKGLGQTWTFVQQLFSRDHVPANGFDTNGVGQISIIGDDIILPIKTPGDWSGYACGDWQLLFSNDKGITWQTSMVYNRRNAYTLSADAGLVQAVWKEGNRYYLTGWIWDYLGYWLILQSTDLINWTADTVLAPEVVAQGWPSGGRFVPFVSGEYLYITVESNTTHRRLLGSDPPTTWQELLNIESAGWESVEGMQFNIDDWWVRPQVSSWGDIMMLETTIYAGGSYFRVNGYGAIPPVNLIAKSVNIERYRGVAAAQATVVLDNTSGQYSPDRPGVWAGVLMPNKQVIIEQGYGTELVQTFTGYIDSVEMSNFPAELRLSCRDKGKLALDRIVTNAVDGGHYVKFISTTVEDAVTALAGLCGLTTGTIEAAGITLTSKLFSWESYADALDWLADISSSFWRVDEMGVLQFTRDKMPISPVMAYSFAEGEDIISLGYIISDEDLYYSVVVYGQEEVIINGKSEMVVISAAAAFGAPLTYGLFSQKVLKIDAPEADSLAKCQEIADRAVALMLCRCRVVEFAAIAVPWLQVGDFIQVAETTTTISELYRITNISLIQGTDGFTMQITAFWYGEVS